MSNQGHPRSLSTGSSKEFDASIPPATRKDTIHLTPYSRPPLYSPSDHHPGQSPYKNWAGGDPRSSSTQSLLPEHLPGDGRQTLLLIYVHGFLGNDTSFQKFPAHVHNLLTIALAETHVVHSKIYPRYKSRGAVESARDDFSLWLSPHESSNTNVILLGHSLGGILAAEVALLKSAAPGSQEILRHRLLGTISFDTPFLGMHPSVVTTGIGSLFRPKSKTENTQHNGAQSHPDATQALSDTLASTGLSDSSSSPFNLPQNDPNYNPTFSNDIRLTQRSQLDGAINFILKYSDRLGHATKQYITSHVEFGSCLADYPGLKRRYKAIRELADIDDYARTQNPNGRLMRRVRFANYYTASTGRLKPTVPSQDLKETSNIPGDRALQDNLYAQTNRTTSLSAGPNLSVDEYSKDSFSGESSSDLQVDKSFDTSAPEIALEDTLDASREATPLEYGPDGPSSHSDGILPPIPPVPDAVPPFDPSQYTTKAEQKDAYKEHTQMVKNYEKAKKARDKAVRNRDKAIAKLEKATAKEQRQQAKQNNRHTSSGQLSCEEPGRHIGNDSMGGQASDRSMQPTSPVKDRKFCALPPKDANGDRDPLWIRVHMKGMDEVVAHQSLFFPSDTYEKLVGDVSAQIEQWVNDDATTRVIMGEMESMPA